MKSIIQATLASSLLVSAEAQYSFMGGQRFGGGQGYGVRGFQNAEQGFGFNQQQQQQFPAGRSGGGYRTANASPYGMASPFSTSFRPQQQRGGQRGGDALEKLEACAAEIAFACAGDLGFDVPTLINTVTIITAFKEEAKAAGLSPDEAKEEALAIGIDPEEVKQSVEQVKQCLSAIKSTLPQDSLCLAALRDNGGQRPQVCPDQSMPSCTDGSEPSRAPGSPPVCANGLTPLCADGTTPVKPSRPEGGGYGGGNRFGGNHFGGNRFGGQAGGQRPQVCPDASRPSCTDGSAPTRSPGSPPICANGLSPLCADGTTPVMPTTAPDAQTLKFFAPQSPMYSMTPQKQYPITPQQQYSITPQQQQRGFFRFGG